MSAIACMIVLLGGAAASASAEGLRRIVVFRDGTSSRVQRAVVVQSGSELLRPLSLINGAAIKLPAAGTEAALAYLKAHPAVSGVYDDPVIGAHGEVVAQGAGGDGAGGDGAGGDGAGGDGAGGDGAGGDGAGGDGAGGDGAGGDGAGGDHLVYITPVAAPRYEMYPWGIERIGAAAVSHERGMLVGNGVKIAVFDTGIDRNHPELARNIVGGFNAIAGTDPRDWDDDNGHGTAMAGIIAARLNRAGIVGGASHALLYAVKVLDKDGKGHTSDGIHALGVIAARPDIRVINMSYGTSLVWPLFQLAIQRSHELGKIIVASRGNGCTPALARAQGAGGDGAGGDGAGGDGAGGDGAGGDGAGGDAGCDAYAVKYPAAYPEVIAVGATTAQDKVASYSLWGGVDVVAPGGTSAQPILTTNVGGGYGTIRGTSPATAHVTAAVALALQMRPQLSFDQVVELLQGTANHLECPNWPSIAGCPSDRQGAGLIDVQALVNELRASRSHGH